MIPEEDESHNCGTRTDFDIAATLADVATVGIGGGFATTFEQPLMSLEAFPSDCKALLANPAAVQYDLSVKTEKNTLSFSIPASTLYLSKSVIADPLLDPATLTIGLRARSILKLGELEEIPAGKDQVVKFTLNKPNFRKALLKLLAGNYTIIFSPKPFDKGNLQRRDATGKLITYIPSGTGNLKIGLTIRWALTPFNVHCLIALANAATKTKNPPPATQP
jgi:hypothetical protein